MKENYDNFNKRIIKLRTLIQKICQKVGIDKHLAQYASTIAEKNSSDLFVLNLNMAAGISIILMEMQFGIYEKIPPISITRLLKIDLKEVSIKISEIMQKRELLKEINIDDDSEDKDVREHEFKENMESLMNQSFDLFM